MDCRSVKRDYRAVKDQLKGKRRVKDRLSPSRIDKYSRAFGIPSDGLDSRKQLQKVGLGLREAARRCDRSSGRREVVIHRDRLRELGVEVDDDALRNLEAVFYADPTQGMIDFQRELRGALQRPGPEHLGVSSVALKQWFAQARDLLVDVISHLTNTSLGVPERTKLSDMVSNLLLAPGPEEAVAARNLLLDLKTGGADATAIRERLDNMIRAVDDKDKKQALTMLQLMANDPKYLPMASKYLESVLETSLRSAGLGQVAASVPVLEDAEGGQQRKILHDGLVALKEMAQTLTERALEVQARIGKEMEKPVPTKRDMGRVLRSVVEFVQKAQKETYAFLVESCHPGEERGRGRRLTFKELWNEASYEQCRQWKENFELYKSMLARLTEDARELGLVEYGPAPDSHLA